MSASNLLLRSANTREVEVFILEMNVLASKQKMFGEKCYRTEKIKKSSKCVGNLEYIYNKLIPAIFSQTVHSEKLNSDSTGVLPLGQSILNAYHYSPAFSLLRGED